MYGRSSATWSCQVCTAIFKYLEQMVAWRLFRRPTARYDANGSRIHMRKLHMETPADKTVIRNASVSGKPRLHLHMMTVFVIK